MVLQLVLLAVCCLDNVFGFILITEHLHRWHSGNSSPAKLPPLCSFLLPAVGELQVPTVTAAPAVDSPVCERRAKPSVCLND